ncbi:hypothetical protein [Cellulosilyticum ruminicola]|uniref:hypothetical protein n=1 Tax=Cellulosilyticum ruminicola TaxID=425254 RepID=UPI0006CF67CE|nr:hypothetical protein [Cellulosilyticum ruminicola]
MNKKVKVVLAVISITAITLYAADNGLGSSSDPLVTKSYVDQKITEISGNMDSSSLAKQVATQQALIENIMEEISGLKNAETPNNNVFEVVVVQPGQVIYGKQSTEMIMRSGKAQAVAVAAGGLQDITSGEDLSSGMEIPKNHLLIIPREDGRGLLADTKLTVMVRGGYTII